MRTVKALIRNLGSAGSDALKSIFAPVRNAQQRDRLLAHGRQVARERPPLAAQVQAGETRYLAVLRFDNIGDYLMFRNFLPLLREAAQERGLGLLLAGNPVWRELAESLDGAVVDRFEWFPAAQQRPDAESLGAELARFAALPVEEIFVPNAGRTDVLDAFCIASTALRVSAIERVRTSGHGIERFELPQVLERELGKTLCFIPYPKAEAGWEFELLRHALRVAFGKEMREQGPRLLRSALPDKARETPARHGLAPRQYLVLFPGASTRNRRWAPEGFAAVAAAWIDAYDLPVVLCGGPQDKELSEVIAQSIARAAKVVNLAGATTLTELAAVIGEAALLVSNDTGATHFAACLGTPFVVVSRGSAFDHFVPYPPESGVSYRCVFTPSFERLRRRRSRADLYRWDGRTWLGEIAPQRVIAAMHELAQTQSVPRARIR